MGRGADPMYMPDGSRWLSISQSRADNGLARISDPTSQAAPMWLVGSGRLVEIVWTGSNELIGNWAKL